MVNDGNKGSFPGDYLLKPGSSKQNFDSYQLPPIHRSEKSAMETEGRQFSDFYRNSSEEMFIKSLMETSMGMPVPTMEMLGFKNLSQNFRADSEELFRSWLTNGEARNFYINQGHSSSNIAHRTRQASRRLSTEMAGLSGQQPSTLVQKKKSSDVLLVQNNPIGGETSGEFNQSSVRTATERGFQASNLYLAKAWFHSSQPMTRSRSSELRKRYAAMQNAQTSFGIEAGLISYGNGVSKMKEELSDPNDFNDITMSEIPNQLGTFMTPSNSSSSAFDAFQTGNADKVSSVVSMLKGTLERKKLGNQIDEEAVQDSSIVPNGTFNQGQGNHFHEIPAVFADVPLMNPGVLQAVQGPMDLDLEGFVNPTNAIPTSTVSREASQSESSAAAPVISFGLDACDGPSNSSQALSVCESSKKQVGKNWNTENGSKSKGMHPALHFHDTQRDFIVLRFLYSTTDFREMIIDNLKDDRKQRGGLVRYGSVTSADSVDKADPTKKRRVERSRKMAEAKERNSTPPIPSDMQAVLKRCETLEKEVRSLKLNLSFMNRKDSEQTKQIEELQKQNEELTDEKERLLEEIERIISDSGNM
ncbi:ATPase family associated with various cellular activities, putative isoform 1 [Hibiscus syriacus]|uniref:ATPase family associated with various cellular activities, putative isoform 1 n=1 Tax=Hibiscus syriacus TaxID=106335 RepID=A0A6A2XFI0_HIBSY|nr:ATPase family associated with various cellular activities, putative isoform 1 [Hibiscus syriacus]